MIALDPGTRIDDYEILKILGQGGMATVFLARDSRHGRDVAIKVMNPQVAAAVGAERFLREIDISARLNHPHVIPLFDSGATGDLLYYVMPCVSGESLRARLERERQLSIEEAVRLAREIASALGHAHRQGLVHRDIKPENILLAEGIPLVADFGVAHIMRAAAAGDATSLQTAVGAVLGTPQYMSPEQASGQDVDGRSDLYSLACILYEMLAGQPPFVARTADAVMRMHVTAEPRKLSDLRPSVPPGLVQAVARGLAKLPADRFQSAAQFAEALGAAASGSIVPPLAPQAASRTNLPKPRTPFVGRQREIAECAGLLDETRLLTLTGIGGTGKTRLAIVVGEKMLPACPDGVWFVDLAALTDGQRVMEAIGASLGIQESAGKDLNVLVGEQVRSRRLLLILDNCEHLRAACAAAADLLLDGSDTIRLLTTCREALGVEGERLLPVQPLELPSSSGAVDLARVGASDAVKLFVDRVRHVVPEFTLHEGNAAAVTDVCRQLDGIPLAIELAAARAKILSVEQIRSMLGDRFRLLAAGNRTAVPRHQTLEAVIQWSYDQLSAEEQRLLRFLSVFAGGWTLDTATRVFGDAADEFEILDLLGRLNDKSLVVVHRQHAGAARYGLLETVRQYAAGRLSLAGEHDQARARHADAFLAIAERAYAEGVSREASSSALLETEHDNLRIALDWLRQTNAEHYLQLAGALAWFWQARSHLLEGRRHLTFALDLSSPGPVRASRARALWGAANLLAWQGDPGQSLAWMQEALQMWRDLGCVREISVALEGLGWAQLLGGADEEACATFEESLRLQRASGDPDLVNRAMVALAQALVALSRVDEARAYSTEILAFSRTHNDRRSEHSGWHYLADCALIEGACAEAAGLYRESLVLAEGIGDKIEIGFEIQGIAMSLAGLGEPELALRLGGAVEAELDRIGASMRVRFWDALLERYLGAARQSLEPERAASAWARGRDMSLEDAIALALETASRTGTGGGRT
jgi:predicted ATPase/tRNA A-37 threonylcarbamoyl transferase component Bud32